jgi:ribosomal protein S6--L-glutamate ligase
VLTAYWRIAALGSFHNYMACGADYSFQSIPSQALQLVTKIALTLGITTLASM